MKNDMGCFTIVLMILLVGALAFGMACLDAAIALWLWNSIMVTAFSLPTMSFWPMFGMIWLFHILFGRSNKIVTTAVDEWRKDR